MASFIDNIPQFNPYISQMPLEQMAQVGMYKQQKYDEGVQKIQSYIDNVAGLDVIHDSDKQYLQSKLDELGGKLKTVAAGDFSNFQLVNSVGGMTNQIAKDNNIQNAVASTAWYRKQREKIQKDIDEGKSNPSNIYNFDKFAQTWLSTKQVGQKFTKDYIPNFDVDKYTRETFNALKPGGYTFEQVYETDSNGNILIDRKTGKPVFSPIMTRLEQEGLFPKQVKDTIEQIFSDPRVSQQLQITGEYNYRNYSEENLREKLQSSINNKTATLDSQLADLNIQKNLGKDVQADIDKISSQIKNITDSYQPMFELINTNPDAIRGAIYKDDTYDNYTSMYGVVKEKKTTHENPGWNQMFKQQQEINQNRRHAEQLGLGYAKMRQDDEHFKTNVRMQMMQFQAKNLPTGDAPREVAMKSAISLVDLEDRSYTNAAEKAQDAVYDMVIASGALEDNINNQIQASGGKISPKNALMKIAEYNSKRLGMNPEQYVQWLYNKANTHISNAGNANLTYTQRIAKDNADKAVTSFKQAQATRMKIDERAGTSNMLELTRNLKTEEVVLNKQKIKLTPQDQYDIAMAYAGSDFYESGTVKAEAKAAQKRLESKGIDKNLTKQIIEEVQRNKPLGKTGEIGTARENRIVASAISNLISIVDKKENVASIQKRAEVIKEYYRMSPVLQKNIFTEDEKTNKLYGDKVLGMIGTYQSAGQQESPNFTNNYENMGKIASREEKGTIEVKGERDDVTGDVVSKLVFMNANGKFVGEMTISDAEAMDLNQDVRNWWQPSEYKSAEIMLSATGNSTTSFSGKLKDPQTYINNDVLFTKTPNIFPNLMGMPDDIKANVSVVNSSQGPVYIGHIFAIGENGEIYKPKELPPSGSMGEVIEKFRGLTPQMIEQYKIESRIKK